MAVTVAGAIAEALGTIASPTARLDAELLLSKVTALTRSELFVHADRMLCASELEQFHTLLQSRREGMPVAYLLGQQSFWEHTFVVNQSTLIPRPETEMLVEWVLEQYSESDVTGLELGTGCGAVAISLAKARPRWSLLATDVSAEALAVARINVAQCDINNLKLLQSDWYAAMAEASFDFVVCNPPYLSCDDPHLRQGGLTYEPASALVAGVDGCEALRKVIDGAGGVLRSGGVLLLEHGYQQADQVADHMTKVGFLDVELLHDLAGLPRVTLGYHVTD